MTRHYLDEIDLFAVAWLRELMRDGLIPPATIDPRSITDVKAGDLKGYTQCHFFGGVAGWCEALRIAGWPATRSIWTGSCPCQPFSCAGKGKGEKDARHLWPEFRRLIAECLPPAVVGEQVASKAGREWLSGVRADLEALGYAVGAADLCAAGTGAPHIRQRLFWGAYRLSDAGCISGERRGANLNLAGTGETAQGKTRQREWGGDAFSHCQSTSGLSDACGSECSWGPESKSRPTKLLHASNSSQVNRLSDAPCNDEWRMREGIEGNESVQLPAGRHGSTLRLGDSILPRLEGYAGHGDNGDQPGRVGANAVGSTAETGWSDSYPVACLDGKTRRVPVESEFQFVVDGLSEKLGMEWDQSLFPLSRGKIARTQILKGAGNAIVPQVAAEFITAFFGLEVLA